MAEKPGDGEHSTRAGSGTDDVVIIGAGPGGLTAAYLLAKAGIGATVLEADGVVGGISRTVEREGWLFDIGGHRFFTKVDRVNALWLEILGEDDFLRRDRLSRIYYRGKLFDYPLRAFNALSGLGLIEAARCFASYVWARIRPPKDQTKLEGWVSARFGRRLYGIFFKTYSEKVWGMPATEIEADWAVQRIKNLSLFKAVLNAMGRRGNDVTSLIESFRYPKRGPGMMWERAREKAEALGAHVLLDTPAQTIRRDPSSRRATAVVAGVGPERRAYPLDHLISSMPINELALAMDPPAPDPVRAAALALRHRDFLTVALVVPHTASFPDNWIYIHDPGVEVGRIQNFGSWSPFMVKEGRTCLGLEYFVTAGDPLWTSSDADLVALATREVERLRLAEAGSVEAGFVVRMPKAYPLYDPGYRDRVDVIRQWLADEVPNVHPVGRNGMHRYNNQDHSMLTAALTVDNIVTGSTHDVWDVNVEAEYHEEVRERPAASPPLAMQPVSEPDPA